MELNIYGDALVFSGLLIAVVASKSNTIKDRDISTISSSLINSLLIVFGSLVSIPGIIFCSLFLLDPWYKIIIFCLVVLGIYWLVNKKNFLKLPRIIDTLFFLYSSFVFIILAIAFVEAYIF